MAVSLYNRLAALDFEPLLLTRRVSLGYRSRQFSGGRGASRNFPAVGTDRAASGAGAYSCGAGAESARL